MSITTYEKRANQLGGLLQTYRVGFLHQHPLTLEPYGPYASHSMQRRREGLVPNQDFGCYACHSTQPRRERSFVFRCHDCGFNIHLECTFISKDEQLLTVCTHQHPLMRFIIVPKDCILCHFCGKYCSALTYACFPCNFFLHPWCYNPEFPREIQHFYHKCPLSLYTYNPDQYYRCICRACYQPLQRRTFYYGCVRCGFEMHLDCTLLATTTVDKLSTEEEIQHFLHGHPLSQIKYVGESSCYACGKRCTNNSPTYTCFHPSCRNKVYICTTCKELPKQICHPFHPYHTLTLLQQYHPDLQQIDWTAPLPGTICNVCRKDSNIVVYTCDQSDNCNFRLHVGCSEIRASIQYEGRNHLLHVKAREIIDAQVFNCSACKSTTCDSYAFSCLHLNCDFNLHLLCGPLPSTIKHKCHSHHLILTQYSLATFENEEDDEFCCDACEEDRDPLLPIYQCEECKFAAEVKCVISEVILSLQGDYGDVELRNPNGQFVRMVTKLEAAKQMVQVKEEQLELDLNLYGILKSLSEDEKNELGTVLEAIKRERDTAKEILSCEPDEVVLFSDKAYKQFIKFLDDHDTEIPIDQIHQGSFLDLIEWFSSKLGHKEEAINVSGYTSTQKLAPILKHLLSKHGDISDRSSLSPRVKGFIFHMLCEYIYNMKNIKVVEITHDLLLDWGTILKTLQRAGFRIQFAVDHFKRISCAHFGLYVSDQVVNALNEIDRDISKLSKDIEALKVKHKCIISAQSTKSTFIEKCLREGWSLKRWRAGGLP